MATTKTTKTKYTEYIDNTESNKWNTKVTGAESNLNNLTKNGYQQSNNVTKLQNEYNQLKATDPTKKGYQQSKAVTTAYNNLQNLNKNKPADYQSPYSEQIQGLLDKVMNKDPFQYDLNADPLYQQYKNQYTRLGQNAMLDTMANAAALSGGYGNSYASTAGNQAYQNYLNDLNNVVPELYQQAYSKYRDDIADQYNQMGLLQDLDNTGYGRYRDTVSDWYNDRDFAYNNYNNERTFDYGKYRDTVADWQNNRNFAYGAWQDAYQNDYGQFRDRVGDAKDYLNYAYGGYSDASQRAMQMAMEQVAMDQYAQDMAFKQAEAERDQANIDWEHNLQLQQAAQRAAGGGGSGRGSGSSSGGGYNLNNYIKSLDKLRDGGASKADIARAIDGYDLPADALNELLGLYGVKDVYSKLIGSGAYPETIQGLIRAYGADAVDAEGKSWMTPEQFEMAKDSKRLVNFNGTKYASYGDYEKAFVNWWLNHSGKKS